MKIIAPIHGQSLTDIALHFVWTPDEKAEGYRIVMSESEDFGKVRVLDAKAHKDCEVDFYFPEDDELLPEGRWYLKVVSDTGSETEGIRVDVNAQHTKAPLKTEISPEHPYFTIFDYSEHRYGAEFDVLPKELKPYGAISGGSAFHAHGEELLDLMLERDKAGYPWHMGSCGPQETRGGRYVVVPLATMEYVMQRAANLKSVGAVEIYMGVRPKEDWHVRYLRRVIQLCGKYGLPFLYTDGNRNEIDFPAVIKRDEYMDPIREYSEYVVMSYKQNHANASYSCYGAVLGAWIEGAVRHIGLQAENWYWNDAGFRDDVGRTYGYLQGNEQQIPAVFTAQMLLAGVSFGASYYSLEGEGWLMQDDNSGDYKLSPQGIAVLSMLRLVIQEQLIPSRQEVLSHIHAVLYADGMAEDWGDAWTGGVFRTAFENLYGITHAKELFPRQLRYFYLPMMTNRPEAFAGLTSIRIQDIRSADQINERLDPLYPSWFEGDAYVTDTGKTYIVMNSNENIDAPQSYRVTMEPKDGGRALVTKAQGSLGLWQYWMGYTRDGVTYIHANAVKDSEMKLSFCTINDEIPEFASEGEGVTGKWNASDKCFEVRVIGSDRPVSFALFAKGQGAGTLWKALENQPESAVYLTDLKLSSVKAAANGVPAVGHCANTRYGILPLCMNSIRYDHGVSLPRNSSVSWRLDGKYQSLRMTVGFDIDCWMPIIVDRKRIVWDRYEKEMEYRLRIWGDGRLLYQSPVLTSSLYREILELSVAGVQEITFDVEGSIDAKPLVGAMTGSEEHFLLDTSGMKEEELPSTEIYLDIGNPICS